MRCTVVWLRGAEDELARIWMQAADPTAVTDSANEIDHLLRKSASTVGEGFDDHRRLIVWPLAVIYTVSLDDALVTVLQVVLIG